MMPEDRVLNDRLARLNRLEELPQMRPQIVVIISGIGQGFESRLFARNRIVFLMPLLDIGASEAPGVRACVVARGFVYARLGDMGNTGPTEFDDALRSHKARNL